MSFFKPSQNGLICLLFPILDDNYCMLVVASPEGRKLKFDLALSIFRVVLLGIPQFWYADNSSLYLNRATLLSFNFYLLFPDPFR